MSGFTEAAAIQKLGALTEAQVWAAQCMRIRTCLMSLSSSARMRLLQNKSQIYVVRFA